MHTALTEPTLRFPLTEPPPFGVPQEVAPGVLWLRLPLPFRLDHINVHLIEDGDGWAVLDTGIGDARTQDIWEAVLAGPLRGRRLTRMIVTHFHPDHVGLAGWLAQRHGLDLWMPRAEYLFSLALQYAPADLGWKAGGRSTAATGWTSCPPSGCWSAAMCICASPLGCRAPTIASATARASILAAGVSRCTPAAGMRWSRRCCSARRTSYSSRPIR